MQSFLERYRHLTLLVAVLLAQLFLLAFQIKTQNDASLIRVWTSATISPVQRFLDWTVDGMRSLLGDYFLLYDVNQENHALKEELERARIRLQQLQARADEADRLAALLNLRQTYPDVPLVAAEVIGTGATGNVRLVSLNRGADAGLEPNMAVLTPEGVVGKIVSVFPTTAQVLLLTDEKSGVGALLAENRVHGVLKGTGSQLCELAYVPVDEEIEVGAHLLTSGQDRVFPKGIPVGRIVSAEPGEFFWTIEVEPAARLSRLEQVLVLAGPPESFEVARTSASGEPSESRSQ